MDMDGEGDRPKLGGGETKTDAVDGRKTGVIIVPHGSRTQESTGVYEAIAQKVGKRIAYDVQVGYMKHGKPNVVDAVKNFVRGGVKKIIIVPLFIVPGLHVRDDIPVLLGLKEGAPKFDYGNADIPDDVEILYAQHIGADDRLVDVVIDRAKGVMR